MLRIICTVILAVCLLVNMTACAKNVQEPTVVTTVTEITESVETTPATTESAAPQLASSAALHRERRQDFTVLMVVSNPREPKTNRIHIPRSNRF